MLGRTRSRERLFQSGRVWRTIPPGYTSIEELEGPRNYLVSKKTMQDYVKKAKSQLTGRTPVSPMTLVDTHIQPSFLNYLYKSNWRENAGKTIQGFSDIPAVPPGLNLSSPPGGWESIEGQDAALLAKLLSVTNPFRYSVSVPIMISEFLEAGSLLKLAMNNAITAIGSLHLNWVFGWKLMLQDVKTLASITTAVESRIKEFNSILSKGGVSRRVKLVQGTIVGDPYSQSLFSNGWKEIAGNAQTTYKTKVYGTVRWVPNRLELLDVEKLTSFNEALMILLDLQEPDLSTMWQATPWTWLLDYFVNIGDALQAVEASDRVVPTEICLIRKRVVTTECRPIGGEINNIYDHFTWGGSDGLVTHKVTVRTVHDNPGFSDLLCFGFMSETQAVNLFALIASFSRFKSFR